jgi:hypothetical protein
VYTLIGHHLPLVKRLSSKHEIYAGCHIVEGSSIIHQSLAIELKEPSQATAGTIPRASISREFALLYVNGLCIDIIQDLGDAMVMTDVNLMSLIYLPGTRW